MLCLFLFASNFLFIYEKILKVSDKNQTFDAS